jgi:hypothetical protein
MSTLPYINIAQEAISSVFDGSVMDKENYVNRYPALGRKQATFVTLTLHGHLRGCIGSLIAHRPLIDDLIANAQASAFKDPRFAPLSASEFAQIAIEVSLLSEPVLLEYEDTADLKSKIHVNEDGVILRYGSHQATFLPQVWEELTDFESFFAHLGMKAGLGSDPLHYHPEIYTYRVEKIKK